MQGHPPAPGFSAAWPCVCTQTWKPCRGLHVRVLLEKDPRKDSPRYLAERSS